MKTVLQVLFGLVLGVTSLVVSLYLGLLVNGQPDWRTGLVVLLLLATMQWVSFFAFRHRIALQVLFGAVLCMAIAIWLFCSSLPLFWEHEDPQPHVYSITWRSDVMFLLLLAVTQAISFFVFRRIGTTIHSSFQETPKKESSKRQ
jgi:hypothetical protein